MSNLLRGLPAVDVVLNDPRLRQLSDTVPHVQVRGCVRSVLSGLREQLREGRTTEVPAVEKIAGEVLDQVAQLQRQRLRRVINATGIVLHTNLGRAVLSDRAIERIGDAARATNLELSLETGARSRRGVYAESLLQSLTGAEAGLVVNNCAAATMLALQGMAHGREVIISRGQLVEIGGGFRLPEVFEASGVVLREVGTANRTRLQDYEAALSDQTAAILRVHRSNFRVSGFVAEPEIADLTSLAHQHGLVMIDDLGSGCLTGLTEAGLDEPQVHASLQAGVDLVLFSGDKLLGGPQSGILVGSRKQIELLRRHPMSRALRVCKLTLAALEATLEDHLADRACASIPALSMLSLSPDAVRVRCKSIVQALPQWNLSVASVEAEAGGGSLADQAIPGFAVRIDGNGAEELLTRLRTRPGVSVLGRIEKNCVLLDLRTVRPEDDPLLQQAIATALEETRGPDR